MEYKDIVVVKYSGGMGSFLTAYLLRDKFPDKQLKFMFNDTLMESDGLYNFLYETIAFFHGIKLSPALSIPMLGSEERSSYLLSLGQDMQAEFPDFIYDADGRDIWDVFNDVSFMGNTLFDPCSRILKRERSNKFIADNFSSEDVDIAIGIDYSEVHRYERAKPLALPFTLIAPLIDYNVDKASYEWLVLNETGISKSAAYRQGFSHDNCGGFCVKAGLGHFANLLVIDRAKYLYHEEKQEELFKRIGRKPFLQKNIKGKRRYLALRDYRIYLETGLLVVDGETLIDNRNFALFDRAQEDALDIGGCGCAI